MKILMIIVSTLMGLNALAQEVTPVRTVESVDLNQYVGKWYEVASIPQSFQSKCVRNTTAEYEFTSSGLIKVINSCETKSGELRSGEARARVVDKVTNAKLKVTFVKIFNWIFSLGGNYWIIDLAPDYSYAVVGDPSRNYAWILSRTPYLNEIDLSESLKRLKKNGYDTCKILTSIQDGGFKKRTPLCQLNLK
jgi:apolipoprotein D and lipocalin family protein